MLTVKHLAVVRAALQYFDEEISPHGDDALSCYLDRDSDLLNVTVRHITESRAFFKSVDLSYALVRRTRIATEGKNRFPAGLEESEPLRSDFSLIATVLLPVAARL